MTDTSTPGRHERPEPVRAAPTWRAELKNAVSPRTVTLVVGVFLLQLGFILSYVGAFHSPKAHEIDLAVVAPESTAATVVAQLNSIDSHPVRARLVNDQAAAERELRRGGLSAALVVDAASTNDTLLVAGARGGSVATAVTEVVRQAEAAQQRTATVRDVVPLQAGDNRGLTGFYLVIGWIVGGYLLAALLGVARGARPATARLALIRLAAVVPYSIASGLAGALIVDQVLGALTGHFLALSLLGALLVASAASVTMAFQMLFGVLGIGLTVLVFVVLGNPSAGGAYQRELLPPFWRALTDVLPNGAGTDAVRRIVYFGAHGNNGHLLLIAAYAVIGALIAYAGSLTTEARARR